MNSGLSATIRRLLDHRLALRWVFALALLVRIVLLVLLHDSYYTSGMAQGELARNIAEGRGFVVNIPFSSELSRAQWDEGRLMSIDEALARFSPEDDPSQFRPFIAYMMPGQGILLAATYLLTGSYEYIYLQTLLAVLDSLSVFLVCAIGTMIFSRRAGVLAALLFAIYIPEARLAVSATRDAWMPLMYLLSAYFVVRIWVHDTLRDILLLGVCVAVTAYFRSEVLLLTVWTGMVLVLAGRHAVKTGRRIALSLVPIVLLLLPWSVRNYIVFDRLIPTNTGLWMAMWQSFGEYPNDFGATNNDQVTLQQMRDEGHTEPYDTPEYDALFRPKVMKILTGRPGWVAWTMARRLARIPFQMHAWGIELTDDVRGPDPNTPAGMVRTGSYISSLFDDAGRLVVHVTTRGINVLLYLAVAIWFWRQRHGGWQRGLVLFSVPLYNIAVHVAIGAMARYILPTNSIHLLFAASLLLLFIGDDEESSSRFVTSL